METNTNAPQTPVLSSVKLTLDAFFEQFKPVTNHFEPQASYEGTLFETFGKELVFVTETSLKTPDRVWTLLVTGGNATIENGMLLVNRMGYFITDVPAAPNVFYEVVQDLEDIDLCSECDTVIDGDGWNGKCGSCADREANQYALQ